MGILNEVLAVLREIAPEEYALRDDPVGLLIAPSGPGDIRAVGVCLDATPAACRRAVDGAVDLVIAHHPLIYHPLKRIDPEADGISKSVAALVRAGVGLYAIHTNWDRADGGINDTLADLFGLQGAVRLGTEGEAALPRIGDLHTPSALSSFCEQVARALDCRGTSALRVADVDPNVQVKRVAVCGGAGAGLMADVIRAGADAYVTADVRHHEFVEAAARGFALIDAGHGATERPGMRVLARCLQERLVDIDVRWLE